VQLTGGFEGGWESGGGRRGRKWILNPPALRLQDGI